MPRINRGYRRKKHRGFRQGLGKAYVWGMGDGPVIVVQELQRSSAIVKCGPGVGGETRSKERAQE